MKYIKKFESSYNFNTLKDKLIKYGGDNVTETYEEDMDKLLIRGELFNPYDVVIVKMTPNKCHRNCADIYKDNKNLKIVTGWALLDKVWDQHSWLYDVEYNEIIETTKFRDKYFGFILNNEEAKEFCFNNW
jgi:hypothetical protein